MDEHILREAIRRLAREVIGEEAGEDWRGTPEALSKYRPMLELKNMGGTYSIGKNDRNVYIGRRYIEDTMGSLDNLFQEFIEKLPSRDFEDAYQRFSSDPTAQDTFRRRVKKEIAYPLAELYSQVKKSDANWLTNQVAIQIVEAWRDAVDSEIE